LFYYIRCEIFKNRSLSLIVKISDGQDS